MYSFAMSQLTNSKALASLPEYALSRKKRSSQALYLAFSP